MFSKKNKVSFKFKNGEVLRDKVTGLKGVVMVCASYSTGCHHFGIQPQELNDNGKPHDWTWLDQSQLERVNDAKTVSFDIDPENTSGPMPSGPQN